MSLAVPASAAGPLSVDQFISQYENRGWDFDGHHGNQCVDLFNYYNRDVVGAPFLPVNYAYELYAKFPDSASSHYAKVAAGSSALRGDVAVWSSKLGGGAGHVAIVKEQVDTTHIRVLDQNYANDPVAHTHVESTNNLLGYLRPKSLNTATPPAQQPPAAPEGLEARTHHSRVNLRWQPSSRANSYQFWRNGIHLANTTSTTFLDIQVSPGQAYLYAIRALNNVGTTAGQPLWVQATSEAADHASLASGFGAAVCGRAGDDSNQLLVCNVRRASGWTTSYSPAHDDWGYSSDRAWLVNNDGSISYCRRVNTGNQIRCNRYDGTIWTASTSPPVDTAYNENRAYVATKAGPALCGRSGDGQSQSLVCTVWKTTGWSEVYSPANDWGYASDRSWLTHPDGSVSYCRRFNTGSQVICDTFDGTAWTASTSPAYDLGYPETF